LLLKDVLLTLQTFLVTERLRFPDASRVASLKRRIFAAIKTLVNSHGASGALASAARCVFQVVLLTLQIFPHASSLNGCVFRSFCVSRPL
jgi:hypothetical protein